MMGYGYGMMSYTWGWCMMIGIVVIIILGIFALVHYLRQSSNSNYHTTENNALNILNVKFARGEITEEEYIRKKAEIKK